MSPCSKFIISTLHFWRWRAGTSTSSLVVSQLMVSVLRRNIVGIHKNDNSSTGSPSYLSREVSQILL